MVKLMSPIFPEGRGGSEHRLMDEPESKILIAYGKYLSVGHDFLMTAVLLCKLVSSLIFIDLKFKPFSSYGHLCFEELTTSEEFFSSMKYMASQ